MKSKKTALEVEEAKDNSREQEDEEYVVEKICGRRVRKGKVSRNEENLKFLEYYDFYFVLLINFDNIVLFCFLIYLFIFFFNKTI